MSARAGWRIDDVLARTDLADLLASLGLLSVGTLGSQAWDQSSADRVAAHASSSRLAVALVNDNDDAGRSWRNQWLHRLEASGIAALTFEPPEPDLDLNSWVVRSDHPLSIG